MVETQYTGSSIFYFLFLNQFFDKLNFDNLCAELIFIWLQLMASVSLNILQLN